MGDPRQQFFMSELTDACFRIDPSCQLDLFRTVGSIGLQSANGGKLEVRLSVKAADFYISNQARGDTPTIWGVSYEI